MRIQALAALALGLTCTAADAQQRAAVAPECSDDRGTDRCSAEQHRRVLALFGLEPIETHLAAGAQVRRVFYVDGNGRDLLTLSFIRAPGRDAVMLAHVPRRGDGPARPPMEALVPDRLWREVMAASARFDRQLVPLADDNLICIHSWVFTIEATDPAVEQQPARLRRATEDACQGGLAREFGTYLFREALPLLPYCMLLDPRMHRNAATMIAECAILTGDRSAAAGAHNGASALGRAQDLDEIALVRQAFNPDATLTWAGQRHSGTFGAARAWFQGVTAVRPTHFHIEGVHGLSADRARLTGRLWRSESAEGNASGTNQHATVEQILVHDGWEWKVESATVGPFVATQSY